MAAVCKTLQDTELIIHRKLYFFVLDPLRSDYRLQHHAAAVAQLAMALAAAIDPKAVKSGERKDDWADGSLAVLDNKWRGIHGAV